MHDALGHNGTDRTHQYLEQMYYKGLQKDVGMHMKQCLKCRHTESSPSTLCTITLRCAISTNAFYFNKFDKQIQTVTAGILVCPYCNGHIDELYLVHTIKYQKN